MLSYKKFLTEGTRRAWSDEALSILKQKHEEGCSYKETSQHLRNAGHHFEPDQVMNAVKDYRTKLGIKTRHKGGKALTAWPPDKIEEFKKKSSEMDIDQLAQHFNKTPKAIYRLTHKLRQKGHDVNVVRKLHPNSLDRPENKEPLMKMVKQGLGADVIATRKSKSKNSVYRWIRTLRKKDVLPSEPNQKMPNEHIEYARHLRSKAAPMVQFGQLRTKNIRFGPKRIAQELNKKFDGSKYETHHIRYLINKGKI